MDNLDYTIQQYITVFWPINLKRNNYLTRLYELIELKDIENINKQINKINGLRECIIKLSDENSIKTLKKYKEDFIKKCKMIHDNLTEEIELEYEDFIEFMLNDTFEGRVIKYNDIGLENIKKFKDLNKV